MSALKTFEFLSKTPFLSNELKNASLDGFPSLSAIESFTRGDQLTLRQELANKTTNDFADAVDVVSL